MNRPVDGQLGALVRDTRDPPADAGEWAVPVTAARRIRGHAIAIATRRADGRAEPGRRCTPR